MDTQRSTESDISRVEPAPLAGWTPSPLPRRQRVLYFTRTVGYEHSAVCRDGDGLSHSERVLIEMGQCAGFDVECAKDGDVFDGDLDRYDAFVFYTLGDLLRTKGEPTAPMTPRGKQRLLDEIAGGKGFFGFHSATDTFYGDTLDPYIHMIGAEFCGHGLQQEATLRLVSPNFPGLAGMPPRVRMLDEWYVHKKMSRRMHVILAMETADLAGNLYDRPTTPGTWARTYGLGRVFYTSLGHREDVWFHPAFQQITLAGLAWVLGNVQADVTPNFDAVTPEGDYYRKVPQEAGTVSR